ncbi:MAG: hypothetical protein CL503_00730 [Actinobacteria bacterium]|nr:hypothetical protein [Actinomycetota bacterium]|tara:strand:- start:304 stop:1932 length:1629 start_codon:yes stop_codon:yes gene_type:complete
MAEEEIIQEEPTLEEPVSQPEPLPPKQSNRQFIIGGLIAGVIIIVILLTMLGRGNESNKSVSKHSNKNIMVSKNKVDKSKKSRKKIKYVKLFSQLDGGDTSKILKEISLAEIQFKTEQNGQKFTILVAEDEAELARNLLAIKGIPSGKAKSGYELLDDAQTLGVTEFDKRIRFLRALSGELEKAITQLDIIESAKVQIVLPEQRLFTVTQPPVTSSIIIRIIQGSEITDEIVFSIIQLVSNAVENLQVENVSVIDTEGNLLSDSLFERLASKRAGTYVAEEKSRAPILAAISREEAMGSPIIPNYDRIQEWFEIKWNFENTLKQKVEKQLFGIMPIASFKVEVTSDLGPLENGNIVDIKRQTISIVIDGLNDDIFVDKAFKQQVFQTVAGSVGYIRGRDSIQLSIAEFPIYTESEKKALIAKHTRQGLLDYLLLAASIIVGIAIIIFVIRFIRKARREENKVVENINEDEFDNLDDGDLEEDEDLDNDTKLEKLRELAVEFPEKLAAIMEDWLKEKEDDSNEQTEEAQTELEEDFVLEEVAS